MKLAKIIARNFISFKELNLEIPKGLTQIKGWNEKDQSHNGVGKTAVLDVVSFVLFGKSPRGASVSDFVRSNSTGSCEGQITFAEFLGNDLTVYRSRRPEDLHYRLGDGEPQRESTVTKTQETILDMLDMDFTLFQNAFYLSANNNNNFLFADSRVKLATLTKISGIDVYDDLIKVAKAMVKDNKDNIKRSQLDISRLEGKIDVLRKKHKDDVELSNSFEERRKEEIEEIKQKIKSLKPRPEFIQVDKSSLECETCGQQLPEHKDVIKKNKQISNEMSAWDTTKLRLNVRLETIESKENHVKHRAQKDFEEINTTQTELASRINKLNNENKHEKDLKDLVDIYNSIKINTFETLIEKINNSLIKYISPIFLETVEIQFQFTANKDGKLKLTDTITRNGKPVSLARHSDGERRRLEIAMSLALRESLLSLRPSTSLSLIMLDEIMNGLDEENRERVVDLLSELHSEIDTVLMIDHFSSTKNLVDNTINIIKNTEGVSEVNHEIT